MEAFWETGITVWVPKIWRPKKQFSSFLLLYFTKVPINDSQCIFLFRNGLEDKQGRREKQWHNKR